MQPSLDPAACSTAALAGPRCLFYRSPRRTPLPPSSLPSRFYCSQALLCYSLDLLFFITVRQPLPSSFAATTAPSAAPVPCFLCRCSRCNLLLGCALLLNHCLPLPALLTTPLPPPLPLLSSLMQPLSTTLLPLHLLAATASSYCCHLGQVLAATSIFLSSHCLSTPIIRCDQVRPHLRCKLMP
ncbi:hypothetical protein BHM03_00038689 [Ensete ventricosum]|nr:hypothetical protein BHM03_00038689 [Ensete ventricosum]